MTILRSKENGSVIVPRFSILYRWSISRATASLAPVGDVPPIAGRT
jgi:hypothetical protein